MTHEDLLVAEPYLSSSTSLDLSLETLPELGTLEGKEIHPPKFSSRFEDESMGNHKYTSNLINAQVGEELSSVHAD